MTDRDRLIELLYQKQWQGNSTETGINYIENSTLADYLLANGVIVPPCKVGDKLYVTFSTFYAEYKVIKLIYDGAFFWAKLVNEEYAPQEREILRCVSFDINKTIFLDEEVASRLVKELGK